MARQYKYGQTITSGAGVTGETSASGLAIYVGQQGGTGDVGVVLQDGTSLLLKAVSPGITPIAIRGIHGLTHGGGFATTAKNLIVLS